MPLTGIGFCYDPVEVYLVLFNGALGYPFAVGEPGLIDPAWTPFNLSLGLTLSETTLLIFTGLSVAVAFRRAVQHRDTGPAGRRGSCDRTDRARGGRSLLPRGGRSRASR